MLFTIITITFNAEKFLEKTLRSVAEQSCGDCEHLIWDGGSQDKTLQIARKFPRVTVYEGKDVGIADAMNKGARLAKGKFLLHLHADDYLADDSVLERVKKLLNLHPSFEWIYGRAHFVDENEAVLRTTPFEPYSFKRLCKYNFITHPTCFISRELFNRVGGFNPSFRYAMDYDLWLKCGKMASPFASSSLFACFRCHRGSLSTKEALNVAHEAHAVRKGHLIHPISLWRSKRTLNKRIAAEKNSCSDRD